MLLKEANGQVNAPGPLIFVKVSLSPQESCLRTTETLALLEVLL